MTTLDAHLSDSFFKYLALFISYSSLKLGIFVLFFFLNCDMYELKTIFNIQKKSLSMHR